MEIGMRKTKIVCTLGPSTDKEGVLRDIILAGMDVARFNFSHGDHEEHLARFRALCALRSELSRPIAAMLDTKGPEIRLGRFKKGCVSLKAGQGYTLTTRDILGTDEVAPIGYAGLPGDVGPGDRILIDDGLVELSVLSVKDTEIYCRAMNDGEISDRKGINVPGIELSMPYVSPRDEADILFAIEHGFDFIAASFVRSAEDVLDIRKIFERENCNSINIIAKIENMQGLKNIDEIIRVSDGIMIARGDMGVEIPLEELPVIQKMLIKKVYGAGKQVITATQMLDSMMKQPRPTRAEATDVANAIYDGTSAIMLSGETAAGLYPVEAVRTMAKLAVRTENDIDYVKRFNLRSNDLEHDVTAAISHATVDTAHDLKAGAIITVTKSGRTARMISKYRPDCPIVGCCTDETVCRQLSLSWGIKPIMITEQNVTDELLSEAVDASERAGIVSQGELVVITAGVPLGISGTTNLMKVHVVGHVLISGQGITERSVCASLCVCQNEAEALRDFKKGDILVIPKTSNELMTILRQAAGIITEEKGKNSHAAVVALSLDIPALIGAENATRILKSGALVTLDPVRGILATCDSCPI
jgi:pyruvate kinase